MGAQGVQALAFFDRLGGELAATKALMHFTKGDHVAHLGALGCNALLHVLGSDGGGGQGNVFRGGCSHGGLLQKSGEGNNGGLVLRAAANAHRGISRDADEADLVRLPIGDAVGVGVALGLDQGGGVDLVTNADVAADAVDHVAEHFFSPRAFTEAHYGAGNPVRAELD